MEPAWRTEALPAWVVNWLIPMLTAGEPWPQASESGLWQARLAFEDATGVLVSSLEPTAFSIGEISAGLESPAKPAAFARTRELFDERTGVVAKAGEAALYAQQMDHMARQTQYSKLSINVAFWVSLAAALIAVLAVSAGPLARLLVGAVARSGNARMLLLLERLAMLAGRPYATSALSRLTGLAGGSAGERLAAWLLVMEIPEEVAEEVFGDAFAQYQQIKMGTLDAWDWAKTKAAALGATVGALAATLLASHVSRLTDSIPGVGWLNARAGDAPGVVNAFLRYPGRVLNTGLSNVAASPAGSVVANRVVYGQWVPPTPESLLGAFMGGAGRTNTISPFSVDVANAVLYPASTLAGVFNDALATGQSGQQATSQPRTAESGTAQTQPGTGAPVRAALDLAIPAQARTQTQAPVRWDGISTPADPVSPTTPKPRPPAALDQPSNTPQTPSTGHNPNNDTTPAEPPNDDQPGHDPELAPQSDETVDPEATSQQLSTPNPPTAASNPDTIPDPGPVPRADPAAGTTISTSAPDPTGSATTTTSTTTTVTTASAVSDQDTQGTQPAGRTESSKRDIAGLINRWFGPTGADRRSRYTLVAARPVAGTRFVADGRHQDLQELTVDEVRAALDTQALPADFGTDVKGWRWIDASTLVVDTGNSTQHFHFEIGAVGGNRLGRTRVGQGTETDPHLVRLAPRVAPDQVARLVIHELTDTFQRRAAPQSRTPRLLPTLTGGLDQCVTARHNEYRLLTRKLASATTDAERNALQSEIDGILHELSRHGHPLPTDTRKPPAVPPASERLSGTSPDDVVLHIRGAVQPVVDEPGYLRDSAARSLGEAAADHGPDALLAEPAGSPEPADARIGRTAPEGSQPARLLGTHEQEPSARPEDRADNSASGRTLVDRDASHGTKRPLLYSERLQPLAEKWRPILQEKLEQGTGSTFSRKQLKSISAEVKTIEADYTENGVDFSLIQVQEIIDALRSGDPVVFVIEGFGPYLVDYGGPITDENAIPADSRGLELTGTVVKSLRERAPEADIRVASLGDDYNYTSEHHPDGRPDFPFTDEARSEFWASIIDRLKDVGAVPADAKEGVDFHLFHESQLTQQANELVARLEVAGIIQRNGDRIHFVNPDFTNPLFHKFGLRTPNKWLCVALDAAHLQALLSEIRAEYTGDPESLRIIKIVALPHYMKGQQGQLREILNVLAGEMNIEYHNIFYDPEGDLEAMADTVAEKFREN
ncbi:hypothetical protein ACTWPT_20405 [Nonomuraea sp. 3N208]|uniref:hypothetical protein n=1 Tax=Nonomuraea sp. 3N208 TaxID=3457421 RepID=UPI003FCE8772